MEKKKRERPGAKERVETRQRPLSGRDETAKAWVDRALCNSSIAVTHLELEEAKEQRIRGEPQESCIGLGGSTM